MLWYMIYDVILPKIGTVAEVIAKMFDIITYTVSDVVSVYDGRFWTYNMADVIAHIQQCGLC